MATLYSSLGFVQDLHKHVEILLEVVAYIQSQKTQGKRDMLIPCTSSYL